MENAQKGLVIAGVILVTMLVISLGLYIYSKSNSVDETDSTMTILETKSVNEQYKLYEGVRNGGEVKSLLSLAAQHNQELYQSQETIKTCVCIRSNVQEILDYFSNNFQMKSGLDGSRSYGVRYPSNIREISNGITQTKRYKLWFSYNEYGYIWEIHIDNV